MALAAYSPGGSSLYTDVNFLPAASNAGQFASNYGLGTYDEIALGKLLTGKKAGCERQRKFYAQRLRNDDATDVPPFYGTSLRYTGT